MRSLLSLWSLGHLTVMWCPPRGECPPSHSESATLPSLWSQLVWWPLSVPIHVNAEIACLYHPVLLTWTLPQRGPDHLKGLTDPPSVATEGHPLITPSFEMKVAWWSAFSLAWMPLCLRTQDMTVSWWDLCLSAFLILTLIPDLGGEPPESRLWVRQGEEHRGSLVGTC